MEIRQMNKISVGHSETVLIGWKGHQNIIQRAFVLFIIQQTDRKGHMKSILTTDEKRQAAHRCYQRKRA